MSKLTSLTSRIVCAAAAATALLSAGQSVGAQAPSQDVRWLAFYGCWEPADPALRVVGDGARSPRRCIIPAGTAAAEVVTVSEGKVTERQRITADGERHAASRDGCSGWESARWSNTGYVLHVASDFTCEAGVKRATTGLLSFSPKGDWLDVQGLTAGKTTGVRVLRYSEAPDLSGIPAEVTSALQGRAIPVSAARTEASGLATADIAEAAGRLNEGVVSAWLIEREQGFALKVNAKTLTELADAGVPKGVIDVVVALAYPKVFALNPASREAEMRETAGGGDAKARSLRVLGYDAYGFPIHDLDDLRRCAYFGRVSLSCSRYGYASYYGYDPYGYYGYGRYGYGYGYSSPFGYGGWYPGNQPIVVVVRDAPSASPTGGRVVNGQGYKRGPQPSSSSSGSGSGSSSTASSGSGSSGGSSTAPATSSTSTGRTAHKRP